MRKTVGELAGLINAEVVGDAGVVITGFSGIKEAGAGDLTFLANPKYSPLLETTKAAAIVAPLDLKAPGKTLLRTENPSLGFSRLITLLAQTDDLPRLKGIHPTAVISGDARLGKDVNVGPFAIIEGGAVIGDNTTIHSHCYVGAKTAVGKDCLFYPHVTVREKTLIGDRVTVHSGTVIGADGFGYVAVDGKHQKIPQTGIVVVEDDVEIGSNVTIDRARFDKTVIGQGTKIDNLVQIAHNVRIGRNCLIVSQVGISGSTELKDNVILAGQVGLAGHQTIGEGAIVAAQSGVSGDVPAKTMVWGYPAREISEARRVSASVQRLPHYVKVIQDLKKRVEELEKRSLKGS